MAAGDAICTGEMMVGRAVDERSFAERGAVAITFRSMMAGRPVCWVLGDEWGVNVELQA